jgi:hypothetical protein
MRLLLIACVAGTAALLLTGCPDLAAGPSPAGKPDVTPAHTGGGAHHSVSEIVWFQGTLDEAFSRRGCPDSSPRRTVFRF